MVNTLVSIYYANNEGFSQDRCVNFLVKSGSHRCVIELPKGLYDRLRVDIGNEKGLVYSLSDIYISWKNRY